MNTPSSGHGHAGPPSQNPETLATLRPGPPEPQRQCKRCFMTGKACIYQHEIARLAKKDDGHSPAAKAFMLMPFGSTLDAVYRDQIEPCLASRFPGRGAVTRADDVMRTGFVVCEKICKQIQEAQLVAAELSVDNSNVFYELGLAYALEKPIAPLVQDAIDREVALNKLRIGSSYTVYRPFGMLNSNAVRIWRADPEPGTQQHDNILVFLANGASFSEHVNGQQMSYTVDQLCRGAIHRAIRHFQQDDRQAGSLWRKSKTTTITVTEKGYESDDAAIGADVVEKCIRESRCVLICTDECEPCSYFWMGFAHGLEKDVIPITVIERVPRERGERATTPPRLGVIGDDAGVRGDGLPFDVRALWHIYFSVRKPEVLETQLQSILSILSDKDRDSKNRRLFWDEILQGGSASIFVGSVDFTERGHRHVVGEWDYRTVSELSGFFSSLRETMETVIQTPVFQASASLAGEAQEANRAKEARRLQKLLYERNSIIIASADVNDMTEVALATYAGVEPFEITKYENHPDFQGIVGFKNETVVRFPTPSVYFRRYGKELGSQDLRGFDDYRGGRPTGREGTTRFLSCRTEYNQVTADGYSILYGHVAKFRLPPLEIDGVERPSKWAIVLQGISGAATLGVAQALTGARYKQFTVFGGPDQSGLADMLRRIADRHPTEAPSLVAFYADQKNASEIPSIEAHAERVAEALVEEMRHSDEQRRDAPDSVECIIAVMVRDSSDSTHDERKIIWWDFALGPRAVLKPVMRRERKRS